MKNLNKNDDLTQWRKVKTKTLNNIKRKDEKQNKTTLGLFQNKSSRLKQTKKLSAIRKL